MGNDRTVAKFHKSVHNRLRVNEDVDLLGLEREQVMSLDDLETLVHQCRGIDRDFRAHDPIGMTQGLFRCRRLDRFF